MIQPSHLGEQVLTAFREYSEGLHGRGYVPLPVQIERIQSKIGKLEEQLKDPENFIPEQVEIRIGKALHPERYQGKDDAATWAAEKRSGVEKQLTIYREELVRVREGGDAYAENIWSKFHRDPNANNLSIGMLTDTPIPSVYVANGGSDDPLHYELWAILGMEEDGNCERVINGLTEAQVHLYGRNASLDSAPFMKDENLSRELWQALTDIADNHPQEEVRKQKLGFNGDYSATYENGIYVVRVEMAKEERPVLLRMDLPALKSVVGEP